MKHSGELVRLLMTPQEYLFAGLTPPLQYNAETARDWYIPVGIVNRRLDRDVAQEARERVGFVEIPGRSRLLLDVRLRPRETFGFFLLPLDMDGITRSDPLIVQGIWDGSKRKFLGAIDHTQRWMQLVGESNFHLRENRGMPKEGRKRSRREK